ncbi:MAG: ABC transporter ATP-binding protein [Acidimicrobiia bacterium]
MSRVYLGNVTALQGVNLRIEEGEYVALMGPSGSGKTTLVNLLGLLDTPTEGSVWHLGADTGTWSETVRSQRRAFTISFIFQAFHLFEDRTVRENVEVGLVHQRVPPEVRAPRVEDAVGRVDLQHRIDAVARTLSGGEQQRTAVARAIARRPRILICDEPVGNLDEDNASNVLDSIESAHKEGLTVVMVTHDPRVAARSQRIISLSPVGMKR